MASSSVSVKGNDQVIEMRRRKDGGYYPVGVMRKGAVSLRKSGDQTVSGNSEVKVTFENAVIDAGGRFISSTDRWTPPRGTVNLTCTVRVSGMETGQNNYLVIKKNGTLVAQTYASGTTGVVQNVSVSLENETVSGNEYFEVFFRGNGGANKVIGAPERSTRVDAECW